MSEIKINNKAVKSMEITIPTSVTPDYESTQTTVTTGIPIADTEAEIILIGDKKDLLHLTIYSKYDPEVGETIEFNISDFSEIIDYSTMIRSTVTSILDKSNTESRIVSFNTQNINLLNSKIVQSLRNKGKLDLKLFCKITKKYTDTNGIKVADVIVDYQYTTLDGVPLEVHTTGVNAFTIEGHTYSFSKDIIITADEVKQHIKDHTTWEAGGTATIDTTTKLKGLTVRYTHSSGIVDGEEIDATVLFDATVADSLNGGTANFSVGDIKFINPDRTVTEAEVTNYIDNNIVWTGSNGLLDVTKWAIAGTKLYIANLHVVDATEYTFTVQADSGYTVNGTTSFDVKHTTTQPPKYKYVVLDDTNTIYAESKTILYKNTLPISDMVYDVNGNIWYCDIAGNIYFNGSVRWKLGLNILSIAIGSDGSCWSVVGETSEYTLYRNNIKTEYSSSSQGRVVVGKNLHGYVSASSGNIKEYGVDGKFVKTYPTYKNPLLIKIDRDGVLYAGSGGSGWYSTKKNPALLYPPSIFNSDDESWGDIAFDKDNIIYGVSSFRSSGIYKETTKLWSSISSGDAYHYNFNIDCVTGDVYMGSTYKGFIYINGTNPSGIISGVIKSVSPQHSMDGRTGYWI